MTAILVSAAKIARRALLALVALLVMTPGVWAAEDAPAPAHLEVRGFVDGVFAYNLNRPADHARDGRPVTT
jgi:hypothetical protein